jgi:hypothetical protein
MKMDVCESNVGDIQLVVPAAPGQTRRPSGVGELSFTATGRPSASLPSLQVTLLRGRRYP